MAAREAEEAAAVAMWEEGEGRGGSGGGGEGGGGGGRGFPCSLCGQANRLHDRDCPTNRLPDLDCDGGGGGSGGGGGGGADDASTPPPQPETQPQSQPQPPQQPQPQPPALLQHSPQQPHPALLLSHPPQQPGERGWSPGLVLSPCCLPRLREMHLTVGTDGYRRLDLRGAPVLETLVIDNCE
jgi:hypothetical protein